MSQQLIIAAICFAVTSVAAGCSSDVQGGATSTGTTGGGVAGAGATGGEGGSGATGGAGGTPNAVCAPPSTGCDEGMKCSIADEALGIPAGLGCVEAGTRSAFEPCDADALCAAGLWCDYTTTVCKPLCGLADLACSSPEDCVPGRDSAGLPIAGLKVCLAACNPITALVNPCAGDPETTCFYRADELAFDCGVSGDIAWYNPCSSHQDCTYGLGCLGGTCRDWCPGIGTTCEGVKIDGSFYCNNFAPCGTCSDSGIDLDGEPLGACL